MRLPGNGCWPVDRIAQRRADLVLELADDALRIDRAPAARAIGEHVVVVQIAVQQRRLALRRTEIGVDALRWIEQRSRNAFVAGRRLASLAPATTGGTVRWSWDGRDASGARVDAGVFFARPRDGSAAIRVTRAH